MFKRIRSALTYANVVASLALFIALGGVGYAAATLPRNSVGNRQLKRNAVTGAKVKNSSLTGADVRNHSLTPVDFSGSVTGPQGPAGPQGDKGAKGDTGAKGDKGDPGTPATALWAHLNSNGTLARGSHAVSSSGTMPYTVTFDRNISQCTAVASPAGGFLQTVTTGAVVGTGTTVSIYEVNRSDGTYATGADISVAVFC